MHKKVKLNSKTSTQMETYLYQKKWRFIYDLILYLNKLFSHLYLNDIKKKKYEGPTMKVFIISYSNIM